MGIQLLVTAAIGHIKKYFNIQHTWGFNCWLPQQLDISRNTLIYNTHRKYRRKKMYFVTEQFYQMPSEGIFSLISSLFGQSVQTKKETQGQSLGQPSLLDLHLAERNRHQHHLQIQQIRDDRRRRQG